MSPFARPVLALALATSFAGPVAAPALATAAEDNAAAKPRDQASQCFYINQFQQWKDVDDKTIYIRVNLNDYYRLDMSASCPELTYPNPHLITRTIGPETVCTALDWDLRVADGTGPGSFAVPCIVSKMTKLTPSEAAAIPKKFKPN